MASKEKKLEILRWLLDPDRGKVPKGSLEVLEKKVKAKSLEKVYKKIELPLVSVLEDMKVLGIKVNRPYLRKLSLELGKEIKSLEQKIFKKAKTRFNINSPAQLSEILFSKLKIGSKNLRRTKTGIISTKEETLSSIKNNHPIIELILKYRELFKLKSTYTDPLYKLSGKDSRVHTDFLQTGAATGRLSSRNPNLQNIPASGAWARKIRRAFVAERGYSLAAFDYSQMELRVLATVSKDKRLVKAFKEDKDIHALTASQIFSVPVTKVTKDMRRVAKTLNFGMNYGMGSSAFSRVAGVSTKDAREFIKKHFEYFSSVKDWQKETIKKARARGFVENQNGRKRFLPHLKSKEGWLRAESERIAINMPIQGLNADIMKLAMIKIARDFKKKGWWQKEARMLLTIHDELLFEVKDAFLDRATKLISEAMENVYKLNVPLKVDVSSGKNWSVLK